MTKITNLEAINLNKTPMKKILAACTLLVVLSCSNQKKEEKSAGETTNTTSLADNVGNLGKLSDAATKMEELGKKLKKLTPLTNDELKAIAPETLNGLKRKSFNVGNYGGTVGISSIEAEYANDDVKSVKFVVLDGAGETGSGIVSLLSMGLSMDAESESDGVKTKTTEVNGIRAQTEERKSEQSISSSIKFLYKDRYSVSLDGTGYSLSELESFMKALKLDELK